MITYIIIGVLFFVFVQLAEMIYGLRVCPDTETFLRDYGVVLVTTLMYLLYIALVWSEKVRNSTNLERMNRAYSGQRIFEGSGPDVSVDMSTAKDIIGFFDGTLDESKFTGLRDKVVYCEFIFPFNDGLQPAKGILQRWHGPNGPVYLNTVQHTEGSLIDLKVFAIDEIVRFKNTLIVHFQGRGAGLFRVREPDEDDGPMHRGQKEYSWRDEE